MRMAKMNTQETTAGKHRYRYLFICTGLLLALINLISGFCPAVYASEIKPGDTVTIVTPGTKARLCPRPGCGPDEHITRIPQGIVLTVEDTEVFVIGTFKVNWFAVVYQNQRGWISIYDTDQAKK